MLPLTLFRHLARSSSTTDSTARLDAALHLPSGWRPPRRSSRLRDRWPAPGRSPVVVPSPAMSEVLRRHLPDHLGPHVLERILQLDLLRHRHAVLGDRGRPELLVEHHVAALRAQGHLDGVGELVYALRGSAAAIPVLRKRSSWPFFSNSNQLNLSTGRSLVGFDHAEDFVLAHDQDTRRPRA